MATWHADYLYMKLEEYVTPSSDIKKGYVIFPANPSHRIALFTISPKDRNPLSCSGIRRLSLVLKLKYVENNGQIHFAKDANFMIFDAIVH